MTPDNDEKFVVERSNATLTNIKGFTAAAADLTITMNRADLRLQALTPSCHAWDDGECAQYPLMRMRSVDDGVDP